MDSLAWCRGRLLVPGNPLTATLPFADETMRDAILALRAAVSEIAQGGSIDSEPDVARARLGWWRQALREDNAHPAIQALVQAGVLERINVEAFDELIAGVAASVDHPRFENSTEARAFFTRIGGPQTALEARLVGGPQAPVDAMRELGASGYQIRVVRDLAIDARANRWLVPLDLQADFQIARRDVVEGRTGPAFDGLVRALLDDALQRGNRAVATLSAGTAWQQRHLIMQWRLDQRLAARIGRRPGRAVERRILTGHIGNVVSAWREARRLRRAARQAGVL